MQKHPQEQGDAQRASLLTGVHDLGPKVAAEFLNLPQDAPAESTHPALTNVAAQLGSFGARRMPMRNAALVDRMAQRLREDVESAKLDGAMKTKTNKLASAIIDACLPMGQLKKFQENHMSLMIHTGAKGSNVNLSQISCLLGTHLRASRRGGRVFASRNVTPWLRCSWALAWR